jgi:membrane protein DedA with SNARE-associated domain
MSELPSVVFTWLSTREPVFVYIFLFFNACFESLFPPYPSDAFVLVFAFLAGQGNYHTVLVYTCTVTGSISGIMLLYLIAKNRGDMIVNVLERTFLGKIFPLSMIERAKSWFARRGDTLILFNRFLPGMRAPICFAAGIARIAGIKVFAHSLVSVIAWNFFLVAAGFYAGSTWTEATLFLKKYNIAITIVLVPILVIACILFLKKRRKK